MAKTSANLPIQDATRDTVGINPKTANAPPKKTSTDRSRPHHRGSVSLSLSVGPLSLAPTG